MTRRQGTAALVASPVLVGSMTVLVAVIAILIAVQANQGLPFVPTYDVKAEIPGGSNLVVANEVRMGGFRVGQITALDPAVTEEGDQRAIAKIEMKLDKRVEPLPVDSQIRIRPRSALGLKYIQLTPGRSKRMLTAGSTIPLKQSLKPIELDEFFSINDDEFRQNQRKVFEGYGNGLAGRGDAINRAIEDLVPFVRRLYPVMRALSDESTGLGRFYRESRRFSGQIAPVARTYASLFENQAIALEALSRHEEHLRTAIEKSPDTLEAAIRSFPVQRPFLRDSADLAERLRPVADELERSLPPTTRALRVGAPVLRRSPPFYRRTRETFRALSDLVENPNTLLGLKDTHRFLEVLTPLISYLAPFQTVCNYWNYYWTGLGEHYTEAIGPGGAQRSFGKSANSTQEHRVSSSEVERPADIPPHMDPHNAKATEPGNPDLNVLHGGGYGPAIDAQGNADCVVGQRGYLAGPIAPGGRYQPEPMREGESLNAWEDRAGGGSHVVFGPFDLPGLTGGTYKSRELGIDNVEDVP